MSTDAASSDAASADAASAPELGLRERKKRETAQTIQDAALTLVAAHGLDEVTVEQIAAAANVAPRTFFNYYPSKEVALVALQPGAVDDFVAALLARPANEDLITAARAVLRASVPTITDQRHRHQLRVAVITLHPELHPRLVGAFAAWERALAAAIGQRTNTDPATDMYPGLAAAMITAVMRESMRVWRTAGFQTPLEQIFDDAIDALANGLRGPAT